MNSKELIKKLYDLKNLKEAGNLSRFFKTGKGDYGEGDCFLGIRVPVLRKISRENYKNIELAGFEEMLKNKAHEVRSLALQMMVLRFEKNEFERTEIFKIYMKNIARINNWDLVDISCAQIVGDYTKNTPEIIWQLAKSGHLWSERIAVVSQMRKIKNNDYELELKLIVHFISHKHDLIQKACGWMLREIGKINEGELEKFLEEFAPKLSRTTLRYSIERLSEEKRKYYLNLR